MKGNIKPGDKIFKLTDKTLSTEALNSFSKENVKTYLSCNLEIHSGQKISVKIKSKKFNTEVNFEYDYIPDIAKNAPITQDKILAQFNKTLNTCFEISEFNIDLDKNLFIPTSVLNDIRRTAISLIEEKIISSFKRESNCLIKKIGSNSDAVIKPQEKALLLNILNAEYDYYKLKNFDRIYIPLKYFSKKEYEKIIKTLEKKSKIYIYMPVVVKDRYLLTIKNMAQNALKKYNISGAVISELSSLELFNNMDLIANYNFNILNSYTSSEIQKLGFSSLTISPELDENELSKINATNKEIIVYGKIPLMTMSYCLLGKSNRCYKECKHLCLENNTYYLNDRYNFKFRIIPDNIQTLTTIYNSRNINISTTDANCIRYDILDETIEEINDL